MLIIGTNKPPTTLPTPEAESGTKRDRKGKLIVTPTHPSNTKPSENKLKPAHCKFCGNNPKAQAKYNFPVCDLTKRRCVNFQHPDCNTEGVTEFEFSAKGLKYQSLGRNRFIQAALKYDESTNSMVKHWVSEFHTHENIHSRTNIRTNIRTNLMLSSSVQHNSEIQQDKPCAILKLSDDKDETFEAMALIDPASYKSDSGDSEDNILSYISKSLANEIKLITNTLYIAVLVNQLRHARVQDVSLVTTV